MGSVADEATNIRELLEEYLPQLLAAGEEATIAAIYQTSVAQSFTSNVSTIVNYTSVVSDPDGLVETGAAWKFTAPQNGVYVVNAAALLASSTAWALGEVGALSVHRNNSASAYFHLNRKDNFSSGVTGQLMHLAGSAIMPLAATDTIDIRLLQNTGSAIALFSTAAYNYVSIVRL